MRNFIMAVGDSRVGKSTVVKLLIDLLVSQKKVLKVYNHDNRNRLGAYEIIVPIQSLNFFTSSTDTILDDLVNPTLDTILVDMPGQYLTEICNYISDANFFDLLAGFQWKLTFIQPISHRPDCVEYLNSLINFSTDNANYLVILNQYFDTRFKEYYKSMQQKMSRIGGTEITLKALHRDHYQVMESLAKPYSICCQERSLFLVYRTYIYHWLKHFFDGVTNNTIASKYLGLMDED